MSNSKVATLLIGLIYTWCVVLGNLSHSLAHHFEDIKHDHSIACVNEALSDGASDEGIKEESTRQIVSQECSLKLALHGFADNRPTIQEIEWRVTSSIGICEPINTQKEVFLVSQFLTSISAQGPPA